MAEIPDRHHHRQAVSMEFNTVNVDSTASAPAPALVTGPAVTATEKVKQNDDVAGCCCLMQISGGKVQHVRSVASP